MQFRQQQTKPPSVYYRPINPTEFENVATVDVDAITATMTLSQFKQRFAGQLLTIQLHAMRKGGKFSNFDTRWAQLSVHPFLYIKRTEVDQFIRKLSSSRNSTFLAKNSGCPERVMPFQTSMLVMLDDLISIFETSRLSLIGYREFGMKSSCSDSWFSDEVREKYTFLTADVAFELRLQSPAYSKSTIAFEKRFSYHKERRRMKLRKFRMFHLLDKQFFSVTLSKDNWTSQQMGNYLNFPLKMKMYGGHYHSLNGLYEMATRKGTKVPVKRGKNYRREKQALENCFLTIKSSERSVCPYLRVEFTVKAPTTECIERMKQEVLHFLRKRSYKLYELDLEKTAAMYYDIAKTGIGIEFCRRRAVLRDNYIYFLRTGLGLTNNNHNAMEVVKDYVMKYMQKTGDDIWKHQGKDMDQVSTVRLVIEGRYPEDEERVVNVVRTDFRLTNDDIARFLQAKFPNNYGWNRNKQRIVLAAMSYEVIWESLDVAHDLSWLETTADALDYLK
eukprot:augustus_masked-scaffold_17-processed-gene-0.1-mRNA-1 protein AED:1.00 eAED:1.00 QI:0/-1/0/0/-1/1/1/0/501